ncbi:acetyltransferase [Frateuria sp. Soil773]|uniref:GNAT family N-acetyltransferase n=1 Tax=Frateuria sp. Soil773 TaxID=1736407 RepID=UPI0006FEF23A|nr:GNAT family N-acetyltransferase [Frateuria sp. Soil773]KRE89530.1 acetyltransferase [Frateuria sp. Soil773]
MSWQDIRIETDRLILRPTRAEDFEGWAALMGDAENSRHIGGPQPRPMAWRGFLSMVGAWEIQGYAMFSVIEKASGRWIGRLGPWQPVGWPGTEVGWGILRDAWGKGYATEGAAAAIDWAFDTLGWTEVIHTIAPDNLASQQVARRLGSSLQGPGRLPEPFQDEAVDVWGQSREAWMRRRA